MRLTASEKQEIIHMVTRSDIGINRTLKHLGLNKSTFYLWYKLYSDFGVDGLSPNKRCGRRTNKDGDLDLFVNTSYGYQAHYVIQYYENLGGNQFVNKTKNVFEGNCYDNPNQMEFDWLKVVDYDLDGKPEILIEGPNWSKGATGWLDPSFNAFKLNSNNKFERVLIK